MHSAARRLLLTLAVLSCTLLGFAPALAQTVNDRSFPNGPNPAAVATFHSIGLYWFAPPGAGGVATVQFREAGTVNWRDGLELWYDSRNNEYRGSLVELKPGTTYDIRMTLAGATTTLQASTWSETFNVPAGHTVIVPSGTTRIVISPSTGAAPTTVTSGTTFTINAPTGSGGYTKVTANSGENVIVGAAAASECILINHGTRNVIIAGLVLQGCTRWGVRFVGGSAEPRTENIVIEDNEIVGWGGFGQEAAGMANDDGAIYCNFSAPVKPFRVVMQRNVFRDPRHSANPWGPNDIHPHGPQALYFSRCGGNHVFRYNDVHADGNGNHFNDGIGGCCNFQTEGAPGNDSDIYGNRISHVYDDAIESEGGNRNVRIWGNYIDRAMVAMGNGAVVIGPLYVWRNVSNDMALLKEPDATDEGIGSRGTFVKGGSCTSCTASQNGGRAYYFHNTTLQPPSQQSQPSPRGTGDGINHSAGAQPLFNFVSLNNIWHIHRPVDAAGADYRSISANCDVQGPCTADYDLFNGKVQNAANPGVAEVHGIGNAANGNPQSIPTYASSGGAYPASSAVPSAGNGWTGNFTLAAGSLGQGRGVRINNFNDMDGADPGAHQSGTPAMKFGRAAATPPEGGGGGGGSAQQAVFDDFEDGDSIGWTPSGAHSWSVVGGVFRQTDVTGGARATLDASNFTDQMIEADVTIESINGTDRWAGLFVRQTDFNNTYYITLRSSGVLSLRKLVNGTATVFANHVMPVTLGTTYRLRLEAVGQTLKAYVNGTEVLTAVDSTWTSGRAAVGTFMAVASFDNVLVTPTPLDALGWVQDNFKDGDSAGWTQIGASPWTVTSGALTQSDTTGGYRAIRAESYWRDQSIESDVRITGTGAPGSIWGGLFVRFTDVNNTYYVTLRPGTDTLNLRKIVGGVITDLAVLPSFVVSLNTTYKVRLEVTGTQLKLYIDGNLLLQATDTAFAAGRAGVGTNRASAEFDNIVVSARAPTLITDNFEDGDANGWTPNAPTNWSVVTDGTLVYKQSNGSGGAFSIFAGSSPNQAIQARVKALSFTAPDNWVGLAVRYADANNHYYITARSPLNEIHLRKTVGGVFGSLASAPFPIATGLWYKFRLEVLDTPQGAAELRVYVDTNDGAGWKLLIEHTDTTPLTAGSNFGIRMFGATAEYDDVVVTMP